MTRNLKALGLALVAALAMSAMAAASAQAEEQGHLVTAQGDTSNHVDGFLFGTDTTETNGLVFTKGADEIVCDENNFSGEVPGGTDKSVTVLTEFGGPTLAGQNCTAGGFPATVTNNGCSLTFNTFETINGNHDTWKATTDLVCPGAGIEVHAYAGGAHGFTVCTITVPPQNGLQGVTAHVNTNTPTKAHDLTMTVDVGGITSHQTGLCGAQKVNTAQMKGEVTVTAENEDEQPIDVFIATTQP